MRPHLIIHILLFLLIGASILLTIPWGVTVGCIGMGLNMGVEGYRRWDTLSVREQGYYLISSFFLIIVGAMPNF